MVNAAAINRHRDRFFGAADKGLNFGRVTLGIVGSLGRLKPRTLEPADDPTSELAEFDDTAWVKAVISVEFKC